MDAHPHAQLGFIVDARGLHEELPRGETKRLGKASTTRVFAQNLAIFNAVIGSHLAGDVRRRAGRDALDCGQIGGQLAVIGFAQPRHGVKLRTARAETWAHHALIALPTSFALACAALPAGREF